jgi:hypothetical protein
VSPEAGGRSMDLFCNLTGSMKGLILATLVLNDGYIIEAQQRLE